VGVKVSNTNTTNTTNTTTTTTVQLTDTTFTLQSTDTTACNTNTNTNTTTTTALQLTATTTCTGTDAGGNREEGSTDPTDHLDVVVLMSEKLTLENQLLEGKIRVYCTCWWYSLCNFQYRSLYENTCSYNFEC
jgi:hypothetical protein